ncbi:hypothetical protein HDU98_009623 [Podochytrium sp. JEL0797]|nr:hypothetical protein HDU98_009623 [Podochytrium sp. JEL0797]
MTDAAEEAPLRLGEAPVVDTPVAETPADATNEASRPDSLEAMLLRVLQRSLQPQLDRIVDKLDALDARMGAVEGRLVHLVKDRAEPANYASGMQQATATMMQEQLLGLTRSVDTLVAVANKTENVLADAVDNMAWALDSFQQHQDLHPTSASPTSDESIDRIAEAIKTMNQRMESVEQISSSIIPDIVSKGLQQIAEKQSLLDSELRSSLANLSSGATPTDADLLSKLNELEHKFESLPQLYIDSVTVSLQKQTRSLMDVIDDIKESQTEAMNHVAADSAKRVSSSVSPTRAATLPAIPNMGISSRISKLATFAKNRLSSSEHDTLKVDPAYPPAAAAEAVESR